MAHGDDAAVPLPRSKIRWESREPVFHRAIIRLVFGVGGLNKQGAVRSQADGSGICLHLLSGHRAPQALWALCKLGGRGGEWRAKRWKPNSDGANAKSFQNER